MVVVELFSSSKESAVSESGNFHSTELWLMYLEVITRSHCEEDGEGDELGSCSFEFRAVRLHQQPERNMPGHGRHGNPSIPAVRGNIYNLCVQSLLPLMLCISGMTIATSHDQARHINDTSCLSLRLANKHY